MNQSFLADPVSKDMEGEPHRFSANVIIDNFIITVHIAQKNISCVMSKMGVWSCKDFHTHFSSAPPNTPKKLPTPLCIPTSTN